MLDRFSGLLLCIVLPLSVKVLSQAGGSQRRQGDCNSFDVCWALIAHDVLHDLINDQSVHYVSELSKHSRNAWRLDSMIAKKKCQLEITVL